VVVLGVRFIVAEWYVAFIFFFEAKDGIRDSSVTGVQTCALPIWMPRVTASSGVEALEEAVTRGILREEEAGVGRLGSYGFAHDRSEERRVGKECRCRWAPERERDNITNAGGRRTCVRSAAQTTQA